MEGCATPLSHLKIHVHRSCVSTGCVLPSRQLLRLQRTSRHAVRNAQLSPWNHCGVSLLYSANPNANTRPRYRAVKLNCVGNILNPDVADAFEWIPLVDQALLMASIFLTHMAGVISTKKPTSSSQNHILSDYTISGGSTLPGSNTVVKNEQMNLKAPWDVVEEKLMDALSAIEQGDNSVGRVVNFEQRNAERPLSLYAVAEGPRIRLLWASFQWLKQQVDNISGAAATIKMNDWPIVMREIFQKSCKPVFMAWVEKELFLKSKTFDKDLPSMMLNKLMGDDSIERNIRNSGKEGLYAELTQYLILGSPREGGCYNRGLFISHGISILEDLMITLADGVASVYLELISVDSNISDEVNSFDLMMCTLSTRELQKLRNEVALNQWLHQNMKAIVSMYEDRFDLCTLRSQLIEESKSGTEKLSWWEKLIHGKIATVSPIHVLVINCISINVKRTKELRALDGWRYYFSLFLELADITMPLIRTLFAKVSDAISFLLVSLIGRSLGLIYTGIRQSLRWK